MDVAYYVVSFGDHSDIGLCFGGVDDTALAWEVKGLLLHKKLEYAAFQQTREP